MKFYFFTQNIPALKGLPLTERIALMDKASQRLTVPEKTLINLLKLLVFIPVFALILNIAANWTSVLWTVVVFLGYPLIIKPIQYSMCAKYLSHNVNKDSQ